MDAAQFRHLVQQLYVAYYGRPADPAGLEWWSERLAAGEDLQIVLSAFGDSSEYTQNFHRDSSHYLVTQLFQQMFGREPDDAGLDFYTARLQSGAATLISIAKQIADGAQGDDLLLLNNRIAVADSYTLAVAESGANYGAADIAAASALLEEVDTSALSVALASSLARDTVYGTDTTNVWLPDDVAVELNPGDRIYVFEGQILHIYASQLQHIAGVSIAGETQTRESSRLFEIVIHNIDQSVIDAGLLVTDEYAAERITLDLIGSVRLGSQTELGSNIRLQVSDSLFPASFEQLDGIGVIGNGIGVIIFENLDPPPEPIDITGFETAEIWINGELLWENEISDLFQTDPEILLVWHDLPDPPSDEISYLVIEANFQVVGDLVVYSPVSLPDSLFSLEMGGGVSIAGDLQLARRDESENSLESLSILSLGESPNTIMGSVHARALETTSFSADNQLLEVEVQTESPMNIHGQLQFNSLSSDIGEALLEASGTANISIGSIAHNVPGNSDLRINTQLYNATLQIGVINGSDFQDRELILQGSGDLQINEISHAEDAGSLTTIIASEFSGSLEILSLTGIDAGEFAFIAGSVVNRLRLEDSALESNANGWNFDFSGAGAGSILELGMIDYRQGTLTINLGEFTTLYVTESTDWRAVDVNIQQQQAIVVASGVELLLSPEQAADLNVIYEDTVSQGLPVIAIADLPYSLEPDTLAKSAIDAHPTTIAAPPAISTPNSAELLPTIPDDGFWLY